MKLQNILFEALSDMANIQPIYHYTTSDAAHMIIDSDTLIGRDPDVGFYDEHLARAKKKAAISFTRERNMDLTKSMNWGNTNDDVGEDELVFDVVFVINRDTKYKLEPFSFDYSMEKVSESISDELQKIDYTNVDMGRLLSDPEYRDAFINQNQDAVNAIKQGEIDFDNDLDEEEYRRNKGKDTEYEERVIIDKITPLRPYVMDIIYNGPDELLKKKIKKYLGKPTYVGKPRIDFEKSFNNWVYPTPEEFKEIFNDEGKLYFKNFKEFMQAVREGRIIRLDGGYVNSGKIKTKKQLLDYIRNNPSTGYTVEGVEDVFNRYKKGEKMPLPVMVIFEMGEREFISDTIRLIVTKFLKFAPKVLLIKTTKKYEYDDED
jgi:hypothetical protein